MTHIRRLILALVLSCGLAPAFAQAPAPVPALPDTERRTSYSISASQCNCAVNFALYGDGTDVGNWVEVFVNGALVSQSGNWTITSPSGSISSIARPITNAVLNFTVPQTGTVQIVGARRPRRTSQFTENAGVSARSLNQVFTDIIAMQRETWDKTNDVTGRAVLARPGETLSLLPALANRLNQGVCFDGSGNITTCVSIPSSTFLAGSLVSFSGTNPTTINVTPTASAPIVVDPSTKNISCPTCQISASNLTSAATVAALKALSPPGVPTSIFVMGYFSRSDGGEGWFNYDTASSLADDSGTVIIPNSAPATGRWIRAGLGAKYNVRWFGFIDDGVTDAAPALRAAISAVPAGGEVDIPAANNGYFVNSCVNNAVIDLTSAALRNKAFALVGDGYNLKTGASTPVGSVFRLGASIPDACDFFHMAGDAVTSGGLALRNFAVVPATGLGSTPVGRNGIFLDGSVSASFFVQLANFDHLWIDNMKTGTSFITTAQAGSGGTLAHSIIQNSVFLNASLTLVGDNVTWQNNITGGTPTNAALNNGLYWTNCDGCTSFRVAGSLFIGRGAMITTDKATSPVIINNELESTQATVNPDGYLINMRGTGATVINPVITGNSITQNSASGAYLPIKLDNVYGGTVEGNFINVAVAAAHVTTTALTFNVQQGNNTCYLVGVAAACSYASGGVNGNRITTTFGDFYPGGTSGQAYLHAAAVAGGDWSIPFSAGADVLLGRADTATVINKSMSGASNTFTNIPIGTAVSGLAAGVATFLGTPSSANLRGALTDETGTGLAYFQGGDIGTPSAGVGTNLTALNGANLSSGTIPAARTNGHQNGTATNDNGAAGEIGEYIESVVASGSPVSLVSNTAKDITTISLTAGDWDVSISLYFTPASTTSVTAMAASINPTTANTLDLSPGRFAETATAPNVITALLPTVITGPGRLSLSGTTTVHLVGFSVFTVNTMSAYGIIRARRIR